MSENNNSVVTVGSLIKQDLQQAFLIPFYPSTHDSRNRFLNVNKYRFFDVSSKTLPYNQVARTFRHCIAIGDEVPVLTDNPPPEFLQRHWTTCLPCFLPAKFIGVEEGLKNDGIPIVMPAAFEGIAANKHSVHPDILHKLQFKSCIPEIGVPCPRHMDENHVQFPCVLKVDSSRGGLGTMCATNQDELSALVKEIREEHGWTDKILFQELIKDVKEVVGYIFYVKKSGEVIWIGTAPGLFHNYSWIGLTCDWIAQDVERELVYDEFVVPVSAYLHKHGYFGLVNIELVVNHQGRYLVDLNPRIAGETTHLIVAPYMAGLGFTQSKLEIFNPIRKTSAQELVEDANKLNRQTSRGRIVISSVVEVKGGCQYQLSVFGKTMKDVETLFQKLNN